MRVLKELRHILPYEKCFVKAAALDVIEAISCDATAYKEPWHIVGTVKVYGNESQISLEIKEVDLKHSDICIRMIHPAPNLSEEGQGRTLSFLADSMAQLLENTFTEQREQQVMG